MIKGLIAITGELGTGKTTFALQAMSGVGRPVMPERILFVDDDIKGSATAQDVKDAGFEFGAYWNLIEMAQGKNELELFSEVIKRLQDIKKNQYDVIIWDTWSRMELGLQSEVLSNPNAYRKFYSNSPVYKGMQMRGSVPRDLETKLIGNLMDKVPQLFLISHLKQTYIENTPVPGKFEPDITSSVAKACKTQFWLRHNPNGHPVPIALITKGISKVQIDKKGYRIIDVLPKKITPRPEDKSLWDTIAHYWEDPIDGREPEAHEIPTSEELSIIDGTMTHDQRNIFHDLIRSKSVGDNANSGVKEQVKQMIEDGKKIPIIAKELGITIKEVKEMAK